MKKILSLVLVLALALSFTGCVSDVVGIVSSIISKPLDYEAIIDSFVPSALNTYELKIDEIHAPTAAVWLKTGKGSVYTSDPSVVTVTEYGKVTAVGEGTAYVVIGAQGNKMFEVYCYKVGIPAVELDYAAIIDSFVPSALNTFELLLEETHAPGASLWLKGGDGSVFTSDPAVVTVSEYGKVTAVGPGTAYVVIGAQGNQMYDVYCYVVYEPVPEADLSNLPAVKGVDFLYIIENFAETPLNVINLKVGDVHSAQGSVWLPNGKIYTSDANVVTVANTGAVTAVNRGTAFVLVQSGINGSMYMLTKYVVNG